jgi:NDP-sugar pyrophosphorylase family protein
VAVISHDDGTPSGIMLVTRKTLRMLPSTGFVDMKEQGLPLIAGKYEVRVVKRRRPTGLPVRSLEGYIQALHYYHRRRSGTPAAADPLAEDWSPSFSLIEPGATVDPTARIHDSVVLAGAIVEPGAVLVRSVACPGTIVRRDRTAVDRLVTLEREPKRKFRDGHGAPAAGKTGG